MTANIMIFTNIKYRPKPNLDEVFGAQEGKLSNMSPTQHTHTHTHTHTKARKAQNRTFNFSYIIHLMTPQLYLVTL